VMAWVRVCHESCARSVSKITSGAIAWPLCTRGAVPVVLARLKEHAIARTDDLNRAAADGCVTDVVARCAAGLDDALGAGCCLGVKERHELMEPTILQTQPGRSATPPSRCSAIRALESCSRHHELGSAGWRSDGRGHALRLRPSTKKIMSITFARVYLRLISSPLAKSRVATRCASIISECP
jgi:hypothetical protein